jgi:hypothetical protein
VVGFTEAFSLMVRKKGGRGSKNWWCQGTEAEERGTKRKHDGRD